MEIERKFLVKELPNNLESYPSKLLEQGYISTEPVIRIRKKISSSKEDYILTVKSSGMLSRQEFELDLTRESYEKLLRKVEGNIITKNRYIIPLSSLLNDAEKESNRDIDISSLQLELDLFSNTFSGLIMGEVEFPSEEVAKKFTSPEIFSEEVTFDTRFHNSTMSKMTPEAILDLLTFVKGE